MVPLPFLLLLFARWPGWFYYDGPQSPTHSSSAGSRAVDELRTFVKWLLLSRCQGAIPATVTYTAAVKGTEGTGTRRSEAGKPPELCQPWCATAR